MVKALRVFWPIAALVLTALVIGKFILAALLGDTLQVLAAAFGVTLCFYLLFMLEGLQVAGLEVKRLEGDAIDRFLERHPVRRSNTSFPSTRHSRITSMGSSRAGRYSSL